jgi:riboflavin synthase
LDDRKRKVVLSEIPMGFYSTQNYGKVKDSRTGAHVFSRTCIGVLVHEDNREREKRTEKIENKRNREKRENREK